MAVYADDLLTALARNSFLPTAQGNFSPTQLLAIADEHIQMAFVPLLMSVREGYFREYLDQLYVDNQSDYTIPTYAMYGRLESVQYVSLAGTSSAAVLPLQLVRIEIETLGDVLPSLTTGRPRFFTLNSHAVTLYPTPVGVSLDAIRMYFDRRPGKLIVKASAAQVLSVNTGTGVVTYTGAPPSGFTSSSKQDFYRGQSPYQLLTQSTATAQTGSTQTFPVAAAKLLSAGDWVCPLDQTVFLPYPEEMLPFHVDMCIRSLARTQQDSALYQAQVAEIKARAMEALTMSGNRMPGNPKRIRLTNPLVYGNSTGPRYR
jgi:hypothetical protein